MLPHVGCSGSVGPSPDVPFRDATGEGAHRAEQERRLWANASYGIR